MVNPRHALGSAGYCLCSQVTSSSVPQCPLLSNGSNNPSHTAVVRLHRSSTHVIWGLALLIIVLAAEDTWRDEKGKVPTVWRLGRQT
jgi:hypothetical protein